MKTVFDVMNVNRAEYSYFKQLAKHDQVMFLFELYEAALVKHSDSGLDLSTITITLPIKGTIGKAPIFLPLFFTYTKYKVRHFGNL